MIRMMLVELGRYRARRGLLALIALAFVIAALSFASTAWDTRPASASEQASARAQAESAAQGNDIQATITQCRADPPAMIGPGKTAADCVSAFSPSAQDFAPREPLDLAKVLPASAVKVAAVTIGLMLVAGASFAGADWASRSMSNQLLFETRRSRVWLAKSLATALVSAIVTGVVLTATWAGWFAMADYRGIPVESGFAGTVTWHVLRAVVLGALAGFLGCALTLMLRSTVATLGLLFGTTLAAELVFALIPVDGTERWMPSVNVFAWLLGETDYLSGQSATLHQWPAGAAIAGVVAVVGVLSWASFRRRDLP